jgi:hypothetical protein
MDISPPSVYERLFSAATSLGTKSQISFPPRGIREIKKDKAFCLVLLFVIQFAL